MNLHIAARQLSYWSTERHDWTLAAGGRAVYVGPSSRNSRLTGKIGSRP